MNTAFIQMGVNKYYTNTKIQNNIFSKYIQMRKTKQYKKPVKKNKSRRRVKRVLRGGVDKDQITLKIYKNSLDDNVRTVNITLDAPTEKGVVEYFNSKLNQREQYCDTAITEHNVDFVNTGIFRITCNK
jgi:hypothetical protein